VYSAGGKTILVLPSTAQHCKCSRILSYLPEGCGVTLNRGDVHYVVTEYGIAYLHGKNIRERAMEMISIAHPDFRESLLKEAKAHHLIYKDQIFIPGKSGEYPESLERKIQLPTGMEILFRPVKIKDEPMLKNFFYDLSDQSKYTRFMSIRKDIPHEMLQKFVAIDYSQAMAILAVIPHSEQETLMGIGQYYINPKTHMADVAFVMGDAYQRQGIGTALCSYLSYLAQKKGLFGFTADVLAENHGMMRVFEKLGFPIERNFISGSYELKIYFREK
jgi:RimJ/RimL family protein N-acetyltransferase